MEGLAVLIVALVVGVLLGGPILAIVAFVRVRDLEKRLKAIEARLIARPPAAHGTSGVMTAPAPPIAAGAPTDTATAAAAFDTVPIAMPTPAAALPATAEAPPAPVASTTAGAGTPFAAETTADAAGSPATPDAASPAAIPRAAPRPSADWESLIAGRWLNRVGLLAVAIGASYFLKLAIDDGWIGPRGQVALGLLAGAGVVAWSASFARRGLRHFADGLTGLGASLLYLSLWAGASYYQLMPATIAFGAMIAVTAAMMAIALGRHSQTVAVLAMLGGFITPALVSTGRDAQLALFVYLAVHDAALLVLAHKRDWRFLELPAFAFTQLYFWGWHDRFYRDTAVVSTTVWALGFFALFSVLPATGGRLAGVLRPERRVLVLVNAGVILIALRVLLWPDHRWVLTAAVLALSAFHLLLARATAPPARLLFAGLALTFATVAIPIRLDGHWITLAWAIEAAALAWSGFSGQQRFLRIAAYVIFAGVAARLLLSPIPATTFLLNARLATALVVAACALIAALRSRQFRTHTALSQAESATISALAVAANALVIWALTMEVGLYFLVTPGDPDASRAALLARGLSISLLWTLLATVLVLVGVRLASAALRWQGLALFGITTAKVFLADLGYLRGFYRVGSSIALGVVLLIVSFLYQRSLAARGTDAGDAA